MPDSPAKRLELALREMRELTGRFRTGGMTREEYRAAMRARVKDARLDEPDLSRPWWADDLGWLMRSIAQAVHSKVLRDGEHVKLFERVGTDLRSADADACQVLAVDLESAIPAMARFGFDLALKNATHAIAIAADQRRDLVLQTGYRARFSQPPQRRRTFLLDWAVTQKLGSSPRRGDPRGL